MSASCLYYSDLLLYWGHPLCNAQPLRCRFSIFVKKIFSENFDLRIKSFSEIFFLIFLFSFFCPVILNQFADITHLFAAQSLEILFMYN